jgi:hypothetical protein
MNSSGQVREEVALTLYGSTHMARNQKNKALDIVKLGSFCEWHDSMAPQYSPAKRGMRKTCPLSSWA